MELRTMRYFLAVAREENMTRASQLLHVTQPTLSKQLKALEDELGKKLFIRHSFSIQLTEEGILLRKRAEDKSHWYEIPGHWSAPALRKMPCLKYCAHLLILIFYPFFIVPSI